MNDNNLIYSKIINVSRKVKPISKDHQNKMQGYKFRGIDDMYNFLQPLLSEEGIFVTSRIVHSEREERSSKGGGVLIYSIIDMEFNFFAKDGSSVSCITKGEAMDSGDKASNKAMSTALKYALLQMFMIPTEEKLDTDNNSPDLLPKTMPLTKQLDTKREKGNFQNCVNAMEKFTTLENLAKFYKGLNQFEWTSDEMNQIKSFYNTLKSNLLEVK